MQGPSPPWPSRLYRATSSQQAGTRSGHRWWAQEVQGHRGVEHRWRGHDLSPATNVRGSDVAVATPVADGYTGHFAGRCFWLPHLGLDTVQNLLIFIII